MTTVYVNGQECNTGLVLDGHFGWHNHVRMLQTAEGLGWKIDAELQAVMDRYDSNVVDGDGGNDPEIIFDAMDEAERWLNDHTPPLCPHCGTVAYFEDGDWYHENLNGRDDVHDRRFCNGDDADDTKFLGEPLRFVWTWIDGEFFLASICENGDCDDPTCAHWDG